MKNIILYIAIFVFSITMYLFTIKGMPGNPNPADIKNNVQATKPFELSPERGRYALVVSLAEDKSFALNATLGEAAAPDVGYYEDRTYIYFAPGISVLALPLYYLGKIWNIAQVSSFFTIAIFAVLTQLFLYKIGREIFKLPVWTSLLAPLIFGFASTSWSYAVTLYQHHVTTFFIISGFYAVWKYKQQSKFHWVWAVYVWVIYGYAIFIDYPNVILLSPLILYFFLSSFIVKKGKDALKVSFNFIFVITSVLFILINIGHAYYNHVNFGNWTRLSGSLTGYKEKIELEKAIEEKDEEAILRLNSQKNVGSFFSEYSFPNGFAIQTFAIDKGIFIFSPIFLLAILGILTVANKLETEKTILLGLFGVNIFLYSSWGDPWGGWAFGPRYLIPSMAVLSLFIAFFFYNIKYKLLAKILAIPLIVYSVAVSVVGVLTTNQIPPKIEADYLKMKYNFLLNYDYLTNNQSSSYVYNTYFSNQLTLMNYFWILFGIIIALFIILLFIVPIFEKHEH